MMEDDTRFKDSLRVILNQPEGRCVLERVLGVCGIEVSVFNRETSVRDYYLGRQSIGLQIAQAIRDLEPMAWPNFLIACEEDHERYDSKSDDTGT